MNKERLMKVILAPLVTEKAQIAAEARKQVVFKVLPDANKREIKDAVEMLFKVEVKGVRVANMKGKVKRFGGILGRRNHWKKAYVSLAEGHDISFGAQEA